MLAPKSKSTFPGVAKSGSARVMFDRWSHLKLSCTGCRGRSQVTRGTTIAVIMYLAFDWYREEISKVEMELSGDL